MQVDVKPSSPRQAALCFAYLQAINRNAEPTIEFLMEWSCLPRAVVEREMRRIADHGVKLEPLKG